MPEIWYPQNPRIYQDWIDTIENELSDELTSWETTFVDSLSSQLKAGRQLSQKQEEILEKIYARTP